MFFENRYRRLKIIGLRNCFQVQSTISFLISTFYRPTNIYQFSTSFQISGLLNSKNYRPRICYQNATRYQPPKSEFINESDNLSFTKYLSKLNDFVLFFKMERNVYGSKKCWVCGATSYRTMTILPACKKLTKP